MNNSRRVLIVIALAFAVVMAIGIKNSARDGDSCFFGWCRIAPEVEAVPEPEPAIPAENGEPESEPGVEAETVSKPEKIEVAVESPPAPAAKATASQPSPPKPDKPAVEQTTSEKPEATKPKKLPRIVELGSETCVPCKMMAPILKELSEEYEGKLDVVVIDIYKDRDASQKYGVRMIPTQIFYGHDGEEIARHQGFMPKDKIIATFEEHGIKF